MKAHGLAKLKKAKEKFGFKNVQYNDGTMIYKGYDDNKTKIYFDWDCFVIYRKKKN